MGTDPLHDVLRAKCPGLPRHFTPPANYHNSRDTLNTEAGCQRLFLFRIHFGQANLWLQSLGSLLIRRSHHSTRPAPWRPKIHDQRNIASGGVHVKICRRQRDRVSGEQPLVALAAFWALSEAYVRDAIDGLAPGAHDMPKFPHDVFS